MKARPSLHALAIFVAVLEHGSMTAAAEAEHISQPAISAQIKELERYYHTPLLVRTGRGAAPTEAGRFVAAHARRALELIDALDRAMGDLNDLVRGRLVLGASTTVGEQLLPAYLGRFRANHPGVDLEVRIGNSDAITHMVLERQLDFAFVGRKPDHAALLEESFFADRIVAFVAPGDPLLQAAPVVPDSLSGQPFVVREPGSATRDLALRCLEESGCTPGHVTELGSNEAVKRAVEARLGIGLLSTHAIEAERLAGLLDDLVLAPWSCERAFWLIRRRDRTLTRAEQVFLALIAPARDAGVARL